MGSPHCADGEQVSMASASLNVLPITMQFNTSCAETVKFAKVLYACMNKVIPSIMVPDQPSLIFKQF
jgi:hypothetical protein